MAPGLDNEGFQDEPMSGGDDYSHVLVVGAGPAGLMLAVYRFFLSD